MKTLAFTPGVPETLLGRLEDLELLAVPDDFLAIVAADQFSLRAFQVEHIVVFGFQKLDELERAAGFQLGALRRELGRGLQRESAPSSS